jgi:REP element-mobilizing transposase RayT/type I restriction-modification system DNA methylase subunit
MAKLFKLRTLKEKLANYTIADFESKLAIIKKWHDLYHNGTLKKQNETQSEQAFNRDIFQDVLDYKDFTNKEHTLKVQEKVTTSGQKPDATLGYFFEDKEIIKAVCEIKDVNTPLDRSQRREGNLSPIAQAFKYKHQIKECPFVIATNFYEIRLFKDYHGDYEQFTLDSLTDAKNDYFEFRKFHYLLSADNFISKIGQSNTEKLLSEIRIEEEEIKKEFYKEYKELRLELLRNIYKNNEKARNNFANFAISKAQKIIDRLMFVAFCEDRDLLPAHSLRNLIKHYKESSLGYDFWFWLKGLFVSVDKGKEKSGIPAYNGGLFAPDSELDELVIDDDICIKLAEIGRYDFSEEGREENDKGQLDVNILGHIFEQSISDLEELKTKVNPDEAKKVGKRKKDGIFYTPDYITDYIVKNSLGKYLEEKEAEIFKKNGLKEHLKDQTYTKKEIKAYEEYQVILQSIKVLDPACGSGAFLVKVFDYLKAENERVGKILGNIFAEEAMIKEILQNNIYGVDLNPESVEITKLSLWLKTAQKGKKLAVLEGNIKCGNSLIDDAEIAGERAFDWEEEFAEIFKKNHSGGQLDSKQPQGDRQIHSGRQPHGGRKPHGDRQLKQSVVESESQQHATACCDDRQLRQSVVESESQQHASACCDTAKDHPPTQQPALACCAYLITWVTHNSRVSERMFEYGVKTGESFILNEVMRNLVCEYLNEKIEKEGYKVLAKNVLDDHVHIVLVCAENEISEIVRNLKGYSSFALSRKLKQSVAEGGRQSKIWAKGSSNTLLESEEHFSNAVEYTNNNHLKHNLPPLNSELQLAAIVSYDEAFASCDERQLKQSATEDHLQQHASACCNTAKDHPPTQQHASASHDDRQLKQSVVESEKSESQQHASACCKGGFDVIVGNPPYVLCQPSNTFENVLNFYKNNFEISSYKIDLFHLFFEKSINLMQISGFLSFITPNTYLTNKYIEKLRNFILNKCSIKELIIFEDDVFEDASVDTSIIILKKEKNNNNKISIQKMFSKGELQNFNIVEQKNWQESQDKIFNINFNKNNKFDKCTNLEKITSITFGLQTKDKSKYVNNKKQGEDWEHCYTGKDISRYRLNNSSLFFKNNFNEVKAGGSWDMKIHHSKKLVVRQVGNPEPIFAYDDFGFASLNTMYNIISTDENYDLKYLLIILNSAFTKNYWLENFSDNKQTFPKVKGYQLKQLPIPNIPKEDQKPFIEKADLMLKLNKELHEKTQEFLSFIKQKYNLEKISKKLQKFYELDFKTFLNSGLKPAVTKAQKAKISMEEEMELMNLFSKKSDELKALKAEIDKQDKIIDEMVFDLYGLTEEERKVVLEG